MLSLALAVVVGFQEAPITYKSNFEPIGTVVEKISAQTKIPMLALGELKNYPIYVNVKDVSLKELLDRIAEVAGAEWEQKDGSWYLSTSQSLRTIQSRKGDSDIIAALEATINAPVKPKKSLEDFTKLGKDLEKNPEQMVEMISEMFSGMMSADESTMKLLRAIGAKDLSSIVEGRRVVLSNRPNSMQGLMPIKAVNDVSAQIKILAKEALAKQAAEKAKGASKAKPSPKAKVSIGSAGQDESDDNFEFEMPGMFGGGTIKHPELANQIGVVQASFQITARTTLTVNLDIYAQTGESIYRKMVQIPIVNPEDASPKAKGLTDISVDNLAREYAQALMDGEKIDPMLKMVTGASDSISLFLGGFSKPMDTVAESAPITPTLREFMLNPSKNEPLSGLFGPVLDLEAAKGNNVVALPSDDVFKTLTRSLVASKVTVEGVLNDVDRSISQEVSTDGTWTTIRASSPLELRSAFCNRTALANLIRRGSQKGYLNLDDCSDFATAQGSARGSELLALPIITAVFRTSDLGSASSLTSAGFDSLKLYASLSDFQKQALKKKQPVALASFTPVQTEILARMVYNGQLPPFKSQNGGMQDMFSGFGEGENQDEGGAGMAAMGMAMMGPAMSMFGMGESSFDDERTNLLPSGIPVTGFVKMNPMETKGLMATNTSSGTSTITAPEMLGMMESDMPMFKSMKRTYNQYRLATQKVMFLSFSLGTKASYFATLYDVEVDMSKTYSKEQLPAKMQDRMKPMVFPTGPEKPINP